MNGGELNRQALRYNDRSTISIGYGTRKILCGVEDLLFFMHLKYEGRFIRTTFLATIFTLGVLISFLFWDISYR